MTKKQNEQHVFEQTKTSSQYVPVAVRFVEIQTHTHTQHTQEAKTKQQQQTARGGDYYTLEKVMKKPKVLCCC